MRCPHCGAGSDEDKKQSDPVEAKARIAIANIAKKLKGDKKKDA